MIRKQFSLAACAILIAGSAYAQMAIVVIAPTEPPPSLTEAPAAPGQGMVWQDGHWTWTGKTWAWVAGRFVRAPSPASVWLPGHWSRRGTGGYLWMEGEWRS